MKHGNRVLAALMLSLGGALIVLACGDDDDSKFGTSSGASGTSGTSGNSAGFVTSGGTSGSSGTSGIGTSGTIGDAAFDPDAACASTNVAAPRRRANILFIVDKSLSMVCNPPPTTSSADCETFVKRDNATMPTKLDITRDALKAAITAMPTTNAAGITYFNTDNDCAVKATPDVPVSLIAPAHLSAVNASLDAVTPGGLTPIVGAVTLGYDHLHSNTFTGRKMLVLITDGQETCAPGYKQEFIEKTVKDALAVRIQTFVIGAPGSESNRAFLSQLAFNGGTARSASCVHDATPATVGDCHFDLTNAGTNLSTELNAALNAITAQALGCEFDVPPSPGSKEIDYDKVNVVFKPGGGGADQTITQDATKACDQGANGWQYTSDRKRVVLCGDACNKVKADPGGSVSIALGCLTVSVPK